jgi:hypothetical protein
VKLPVPTEATEQIQFVQYLKIKGLPFFRVPSETFTQSWNQKRLNKQLGVVKGIPDIWVIANGKLIALELKRLKGSTTSPEQLEWIDRLNACGVESRVVKGCDGAIAFVEEVLKRR